jgi:hypothetical protein
MIDRIDERSAAQGYAVSRLPKFTDEEIEYIKGTHDFVAVNFIVVLMHSGLKKRT